jgi:ADP-ribose pyrophosphatase YjhB (NUDIX family)
METRPTYCNNCGKKGHLFKSCTDPVISCGVILINQERLKPNKKLKLLMVCRKDSMAYTEFLRGKYMIDDPDYIIKLLSNMTKSEHETLINLSFEELWTYHWGIGNDRHSREYEISKDKFEQLNMEYLLNNVKGYAEPEWGFPKGRRFHRESDLDCAIREFTEETNIDRELFIICKNLLLSETFVGTNGILYRHNYYIGVLNTSEIKLDTEMTTIQKKEVSAIGWKTIDECRSLTRPHYTQREDMLDSFERILNTFNLQDKNE